MFCENERPPGNNARRQIRGGCGGLAERLDLGRSLCLYAFPGSSATGVNAAVDDGVANSGAVYVFTRTAGIGSQEAYVKASNTGMSDGFGGCLDLSSDGATLAVGAAGEASNSIGPNGSQNDSGPGSGAVYVFEKSSGTWSETQFIKASNTNDDDQFGVAS